ncbi:MAG TPA: hypothetical protein VIH89_19880 [Candidatus Sulfotelmatobacter sp.]
MRIPEATLLLTLGVPLAFTACATIGSPQPPSLDLPKPPADLRAVRKGDKVILSWTRPTVTTDRRNLRGQVPVLICRAPDASLPMSKCGTPVGRMMVGATLAVAPESARKPAQHLEKKSHEGRIADSYTDVLPRQVIAATSTPSGLMTYAVEAQNANGRSAGLSNQVRVPTVETLPPPSDFAARVTDQGVLLTWKSDSPPHESQGVHYVYRVYRRLEGNPQPTVAGELPAGTETNLTLTDANIEWEQTYLYHAEAVTLIDQPEVQIEGDDTTEVKVFAHDVFPPAAPAELQAVSSGPGQSPFIDLIWAPVTNADLAGYSIYRREENAAPVRVNDELVKVPAYRDAKVGAGKTYFYSVSAVDVRGNESLRSPEANENVPAE